MRFPAYGRVEPVNAASDAAFARQRLGTPLRGCICIGRGRLMLKVFVHRRA